MFILITFQGKSADIKVPYQIKGGKEGVLHGTEVEFLLLTQPPQVRFSAFPKILLRFFNCAGLRKVDRGLKMEIKPI